MYQAGKCAIIHEEEKPKEAVKTLPASIEEAVKSFQHQLAT